jgi:hypothetical protein
VSLDDIIKISKPLLTNIVFVHSSCRYFKPVLLELLHVRSYIVTTENEENLIKVWNTNFCYGYITYCSRIYIYNMIFFELQFPEVMDNAQQFL